MRIFSLGVLFFNLRFLLVSDNDHLFLEKTDSLKKIIPWGFQSFILFFSPSRKLLSHEHHEVKFCRYWWY